MGAVGINTGAVQGVESVQAAQCSGTVQAAIGTFGINTGVEWGGEEVSLMAVVCF